MNQEIKDLFWLKPLSQEITSAQKVFDVIFGIILPIFCLILDPFIFKDINSSFPPNVLGAGYLDGLGAGYLRNIQVFAYISIGIGIFALIFVLFFQVKSNLLNILLASVLSSVASISFLIGVFLLPISNQLLLFVVGILGFIPFTTAFVFFRNGVIAFQKVQTNMNKITKVRFLVIGTILAVGIPFGVNVNTNEFWAPNEIFLPVERVWLSEAKVVHFVIENHTGEIIGPFTIDDGKNNPPEYTDQIMPFSKIDVYYKNSDMGENAIGLIDGNGNEYYVIGYFESPQSGRVDIHINCVTVKGISGNIRVLVSSQSSYKWGAFGKSVCP